MANWRGSGATTISTYTWATLPSAATAGARTLAWASDLGESGTLLVSNGTRWRSANGSVSLKGLGGASASIGSAETIVMQTQLPIGAWQTNDVLRLWTTTTKSGATDIGRLIVRVGTAGTTADTAITGLTSAFSYMTAAAISGGGIFDIKLFSATSAMRIGDNASAQHSYQSTAATTAGAAATTITDASANALWVSVSLQSAGATDTLVMQDSRLQLITP